MAEIWWITVDALSPRNIAVRDIQPCVVISEPSFIAVKSYYYYDTKDCFDWETDTIWCLHTPEIASLISSTSPCDNEAPFAEALGQVYAPSRLHFSVRMSAYNSN